MERFFSLMIMLVTSDWVVNRVSFFGAKTVGEDPIGLLVLVLVWIIVAVISQLFDEKTFLGKILSAVILPKLEKRIIDAGTSIMTSVLPSQVQPSTDATDIESTLKEIDAMPGSL